MPDFGKVDDFAGKIEECTCLTKEINSKDYMDTLHGHDVKFLSPGFLAGR